MDNKQILTIATDVGYMLLRYGAEVYRVEQSIQFICKSYGIKDIDVFAIPNSLVVTITFDGDFITKTRRVTVNEIDLDKVDKLNELSRYICEHKPEFCVVQEKLQEINNIKEHNKILRIFSYACVAASFTILFGGGIFESLIGFFLAGLVACGIVFLEKRNANAFLRTTFCSFFISLIAVVSEFLSGGMLSSAIIITGTLMILVPGLAITNCMRDLMANDYMAGMAKLAEALMTAIAVALGVSVVLLSVYQWGMI